jgi:hypothetical protein
MQTSAVSDQQPLAVLIADLRLPAEVRSVFVYGSRARRDADEHSDLELGVIPHAGCDLGRGRLASAFAPIQARAYVFSEDDLRAALFRVPFAKALLQRELAQTGITVFGDQIIEGLAPVEITALDVLREVRFQIGRCFEGLMECRADADELARESWIKSCWYGARSLLLLEGLGLVVERRHIRDLIKQVSPQGHVLVTRAVRAREGQLRIPEQDFYQLLDFLTEDVESATDAEPLDRVLLPRG